MRNITLLGLLLSVALCVSCGGKRKSYDEMGSHGLTTRTENLQANLHTFVNQGVIVGQQYGTLEGIGWRYDSTGRSDMKSICDDSPACSGYELCGIERGLKLNCDSIAFTSIRKDALQLFKHGGLVLMNWTAPDFQGDTEKLNAWTSRLADYLGSLQDGYGIKVPVVLLLYPLDGRSWYTRLSAADYRSLYEQTADRLKDLGVTNVVLGCSLSNLTSKEQAEDWIPEGIDVLNLSLLVAGKSATTYEAALKQQLGVLVGLAQEHNLVPGVTTGVEGLPDAQLFSRVLLPATQQYRLSYLLFGANRGEFREGRFCVPYPGCSNDLIEDFVQFYNAESTLFLNDLNGLYLKK